MELDLVYIFAVLGAVLFTATVSVLVYWATTGFKDWPF